jgi:precorrin-6B methylase 2
MDSNVPLPPGILVHGSPGEIGRHFSAVALLQPVEVTPDGVVCAPRAAPELAARGLRGVELPTSTLRDPPGWPDPPSQTTGTWYIKSPGHIPAPPGFDALVQVPGEAFGTWPHATTLLCLRALVSLPDGVAIDVGCGSGLLSQAWATTRGPVTAIDIDRQAIAHARASMTRATARHPVEFRHGPIRRLLPGAVGSVVFANLPPPAHGELLAAIVPNGQTLLVSGLRVSAAAPIINAYTARGFRAVEATEADGWGSWVLTHDARGRAT